MKQILAVLVGLTVLVFVPSISKAEVAMVDAPCSLVNDLVSSDKEAGRTVFLGHADWFLSGYAFGALTYGHNTTGATLGIGPVANELKSRCAATPDRTIGSLMNEILAGR